MSKLIGNPGCDWISKNMFASRQHSNFLHRNGLPSKTSVNEGQSRFLKVYYEG